MHNISESDKKRFWKHVSIDGVGKCWEWQACKLKEGYGQFGLNGKVVRAHRLSYELCVGPIPPGMCVLHACDNPPCVNPSHLFLGNDADNVYDSTSKGRRFPQYGEYNGHASLYDGDVIEIRRMYATGKYTQLEISKLFGVSRPHIGKIVNYKEWSHLQQGGNHAPRDS